MGVTFRSGDYVKFVRFGHRTVKDGEAAVVWNARGELSEVVGPRRVTLWFSTIRFLYHYQATLGQYLRVQHRDGTTEHVVGPVARYLNPTKHNTIQVTDGCNLVSEDDCLVMYSHAKAASINTTDSVAGNDARAVESSTKAQNKGLMANRRIVYGPQFVIPSEQESIHTFSWSSFGDGGDGVNSQGTTFQILKTNKTELRKIRLSLRTVEGPLVAVHLAVSYKIEFAEKCLDITDPMASIHSAILADANRGDIVSMENVFALAAKISTYPAFEKTLTACGFRILQLHVHDILLPHDVAAKLDQEQKHKEAQQRASATLQYDMELIKLKFENKQTQAQEQATLTKFQNQLALDSTEQVHSVQSALVRNDLILEKMRTNAQNEATQQSNETKLQYWRGLQELGVDLTKVLCAQASMIRKNEENEVNATQQPVVQSVLEPNTH
ncbi:hypothetical protein ACA910_006695 [Epithemia clementina (nom. ined.)]